MPKCTLITRTFQPIDKIEDYDENKFLETFVKPLKKLITKTKSINQIVVVFNGDTNSKYHEKAYQNGKLPSEIAFDKIKSEIDENIEIKTVICKNWGLNQGSGTALNDALDMLKDTFEDNEYYFIWSSGMDITAEQFESALNIADANQIDVMGFLRKGFEDNKAWQVPQNTACFWKKNKLIEFNFFKRCNGKENDYINIEGENYLIAGMEDFYTLIRMYHKFENLNIGMIGRDDPIIWDNPNTTQNTIKVKRQKGVMDKYLEELSIKLNFHKESFEKRLLAEIKNFDFN